MVFSSSLFIFLFLPLVVAIYYSFGPRWRNETLLTFSLVFYAWGEGAYFAIILIPISVSCIAGIALASTQRQGPRLIILLIACALNLSVLFYFKYAHFVSQALNQIAGLIADGTTFLPTDPIHLPLGISFFTFHALSYVIDVYRRAAPAQRNFVNFALYIMFFPQLVAGPIIRYHDIAEQLTDRRSRIDTFASGLERFIIGLGKKILIANPLGEIADRAFSIPPGDLSMPASWLGIICYAFQIYFDFSGYSDMAIGLGRLFGFEILENFNYPYIATTMRQFWRRWHISLSNWFRDYLYIPLGGNRLGPIRTYQNLLIVFLLCGLWHGASWNFVIWGVLHGGFLAIERGRIGVLIDRAPLLLRHCYVLSVVLIAWVFFRADSIPHALSYLTSMFSFPADTADFTQAREWLDRRTLLVLFAACAGATPVFMILGREWPSRFYQVDFYGWSGRVAEINVARIEKFAGPVRRLLLIGIFFMSVVYLTGQTYNPFIYFRF